MEGRRNFLGLAIAAVAGGIATVLGRSASAGPLIPPDITQGGQSFIFTSPTDGTMFRIWSRVDLEPAPTPTATATPTAPPTPPPTPAPTPTPITIGETAVSAAIDSGNAGLICVQRAVLPVAASLLGMSFFVSNVVGKLRVGIYDATGVGGGPGTLRAQSGEISPVPGWDLIGMLPVGNNLALAAGPYWLAYMPSDNSMAFPVDRTSGSGICQPAPFGPMPLNFPPAPYFVSGTFHWAFYATLAPI